MDYEAKVVNSSPDYPPPLSIGKLHAQDSIITKKTLANTHLGFSRFLPALQSSIINITTATINAMSTRLNRIINITEILFKRGHVAVGHIVVGHVVAETLL